MSAVPNSDLGPWVHEPLSRGTEVARFVVLGFLGRGAVGDVYAAHDPQLDRKVAIKLLRVRNSPSHAAGDNADEGRAQLIREAQAIAKVSHPNVVVVYDVGTFDGRVFIAMEFIAGHTLRYWLLAQPRTLGEILEVFADAGRGLGAAHDKELVHRDFKPENVMVGADGQVRVMDFGLARLATDHDKPSGETTPLPVPVPCVPGPEKDKVDLMATQILDGTHSRVGVGVSPPSDPLAWEMTHSGSVVGTPAYMSPEQFRGEPAAASTDQFSFCVALYEALYSQRPFVGSNLIELTANASTGRVRPEPAGARVPTWIRRALLRGMSAQPEDRFPSMAALLADLRPQSLDANTRRFAEGAAGKLGDIWEVPDANWMGVTEAKAHIRQAFVATGKRYAVATFETVSRVLDRFVRRWTELYVDACEATHVRGEQSTEVLDLRMAALGEALTDLRALCREFRQATADTVRNAVAAANALGNLERCADVKLLRTVVRPPENLQTLAAVEHLQRRLSEVRALARVKGRADGLTTVVDLERDARRLGCTPLLAEVLLVAGIMRADSLETEAATKVLEGAVWTAELCRHDEVIAEAAARLILLAGHAQGRFDAGEIWSQHAEAVLNRMGGHDLVRGWFFEHRGCMRGTQGRPRDAVDDLHRAIAAKEKALGPQDPAIGISLGNAATYLDDLGETIQAAEYAERAVKIMQAALGSDHPMVAMQRASYAQLANRLQRFEEARDLAESALATFEHETDPHGLDITYPLLALGVSHTGAGAFEDALPVLERAVDIRDAKETFRPRLAEAHFALGRALWGAGRNPSRALALVKQAQGEYSETPRTAASKRSLAEIERWLASHNKSLPTGSPT